MLFWKITTISRRRQKITHSTLSRKNAINKIVIFEEKRNANIQQFFHWYYYWYCYVVDDIPTTTRSFESYVQKTNKTMKNEPITLNELKDGFFFLKNSHRRCSLKKVFLKISQYSQENTYVGFCFYCRPEGLQLY